jgi:hypothetical protein
MVAVVKYSDGRQGPALTLPNAKKAIEPPGIVNKDIVVIDDEP